MTRAMETYHERKTRGVCPRCESQPKLGRVYCDGCMSDIAGYNAKAQSGQRKRLRAKRRALNLCVVCGVKPPDPEYVTDSSCRERLSGYKRKVISLGGGNGT